MVRGPGTIPRLQHYLLTFMRFAIFSDIHSNLEALETAVSHAQNQKVDEFIVLGDTVGYGANPNECFDWVIQHAAVNLLGNHEKAVIDPKTRDWFNPMAREAIVWTSKVMKKNLKALIAPLPYLRVDKRVSYAHGSLHEPEAFHYLVSFEDTEDSFKKLESPVCFVGHTHIPSCFCEKKRSAEYLEPGVVELKKGERYILNPGSVGQPRDHDPRLSFGLFDDERHSFEIIRLEYENQKAAEKIRKAGLPHYLADRLL